MPELAIVFRDAALPQKMVFVLLLVSIAATVILAATEYRGGTKSGLQWRLISYLPIAGPALALLVAAMNAFHMMQTTLRLPASPTTKDLAPGLMEIATLVGLGALCGLVALVLDAGLNLRRNAARIPG